MMNLLLPLMLAQIGLGADLSLEPGTLLSYRGSVAPQQEDRTVGEAEKTFDWLILATDAGAQQCELCWTVDERGRGAWPWIERFGQLTTPRGGQSATAAGPAILYNLGESASVIPLTLPLLKHDQPLTEGLAWSSAGLNYKVVKQTRLDQRDVWQVQVSNNYGPKRTVWVDPGSEIAVGIDERVFMGMGQEFELKLRLVGHEAISSDRLASLKEGFAALIEMRSRLKLRDRKETIAWNAQQRAVLAEQLPQVEKRVSDPVLAKIVRVASQDLALQNDRASSVKKLLADFEGATAPAFQLEGLSGEKLSADDLRGQVTVLHFWDYRDTPLLEPYGQTGYLDFLTQRRKGDGVKVFGVAVDSRLKEAPTRGEAMRGIRRLKSFMNLSYPILLDEGGLLKQFGDPRLVGAELPLFVVVGRDGKIAHYRVGHYEVDRNDGLKELNAAVSKALAN